MSNKNSISSTVASAVGLGAIIGAGIFVLSGTALALAGSEALIAFVLVGIVALLVAFEIGELGSIMPHAKGAGYSYAFKAFGSELGFITGMLLYFSYATSVSAIALGFGSYLSSVTGLSSSLAIPFAIALIFILAIVNLFGIKRAAKTDSALVVFKILVLSTFIAFAFIMAFYYGKFDPANFAVLPGVGGIAAIFAASIAIFFAYSGFQVISTFTSRVKGGAVAAAKAIIASVVISMLIYVLVVVSMILLVPASTFKITADPLVFVLQAAGAPSYLFLIVGIGALVATASATLAMILSSSRIAYQMGEDRLLPKVFRKYSSKRDVASNGVLISVVIAVIMLFSGNIYIIAAIANFGLLFSYLMTSLALIHFRRTKAKATFKSPFYPYLPVIAIVAIIAFMYGMPIESLLIGIMLILSLIAIYYSLREIESKRVVRVKLFK